MMSKTSGRKSRPSPAVGTVDPGLAATMPLLAAVRDLRPAAGPRYERPPSYESACSGSRCPLDRLLTGAGDQAVCTITGGGADPSAVAYHSYPTAAASLQGIPDPLYQNGAVQVMPGDWRYSVEDYCGAQQTAARTGTGKRNGALPLGTMSQALQQCAAPRYQHNAGAQGAGELTQPPVTWQQHRRLHHYPTPPSQHAYDLGGPVPGPRGVVPQQHHPEQFLTPSPDSPGQWSSSSPHSGHSDWSEGMSSPPQSTVGHHHLRQSSLSAGQRLPAASAGRR